MEIFKGTTESDEYNQLIVNRLRFNNDHTLICLSTNIGYKIYESDTFMKVSKDEDHISNNVGDLKDCLVLYNTRLIAYIINDPTKENFLFLFDHEINRKISVLYFHNQISNFYISMGLIIVFPNNDNKCYIFELISLKFICCLDDLKSNNLCLYENINKQICTIIYPSLSKRSNVNIYNYKWDKCSKKIIGVNKIKINTTFPDIQLFSINKAYIIVSNEFGNKIHLYYYSTKRCELAYCIYLGSFNYEITSCQFDIKNKFLLLCTYHHYKDSDRRRYIKLFNLKELGLSYKGNICGCDDHKDSSLYTSNSKSFNFYFKKVFEWVSPLHCKLKLNINKDTLIKNDLQFKNLFYFINSNGEIDLIEFNRKKKNDIKYKKKMHFKSNEDILNDLKVL